MFQSRGDDKCFPRVLDFYHGKSIFMTGATGFFGTVLLELLLRCSPGIKAIYILIRTKKNVQPEIRKEQIFTKKIFEQLKESNPECLNKVHAIPGEASFPNLGMSDEHIKLLTDEVSIVFHCAAVINFRAHLMFVLLNNVLSLNSVIKLCRRMKKFKALVYTSTAYSNCNYKNVVFKEEVYRLPFRSEKFLDALKNEDNEKLLELFAHCKPDFPNTYLFSKCLAENVIMDTASDLPVVIIRPSIIISTWKQPIPGYVEEKSGIAALSIGAGKGFIKVLHADPNVKLNLVPADVVANAHVLAAWSIGTKKFAYPLVVNCTATENLNIKISDFIAICMKLCTKFPLPRSFRKSTHFSIIPNRYMYYIVAIYQHYLPAVSLDGMLKILGKNPRIYSIYRFLETVMSSLKFFMFRNFEFERKNLEHLDKLMHPEDRKDLSLDFKDAIFKEIAFTLPEASPFYDWKIDKKSPTEREKIKYWRYMMTNFIQGMFVAIFGIFIYWMFSLTFYSFLALI